MRKIYKIFIAFLFLLLALIIKASVVNAAEYIWPIGGTNSSETYIDYEFYGDRSSTPIKDGKKGREYIVNNILWPDEKQYYSKCESHYGMDITGINGHSYTVVSIVNGTVIATSADRVKNPSVNYIDRNQRRTSAGLNDGGGYGNYIVIQETKTGRCFLYAHLKGGSLKVSKGSTVTVGQEIATMGSSGDSGHMHLHFEIRKNKASTLNVNKYGKHYLVKTTNSTNLDPELYVGSSSVSTDPLIKALAKPSELKVIGDLNNDGVINSSDASLCLILSAYGTPARYTYMIPFADINKDGRINASDASLILIYSANMNAGKVSINTSIRDYFKIK